MNVRKYSAAFADMSALLSMAKSFFEYLSKHGGSVTLKKDFTDAFDEIFLKYARKLVAAADEEDSEESEGSNDESSEI